MSKFTNIFYPKSNGENRSWNLYTKDEKSLIPEISLESLAQRYIFKPTLISILPIDIEYRYLKPIKDLRFNANFSYACLNFTRPEMQAVYPVKLTFGADTFPKVESCNFQFSIRMSESHKKAEH